MGTHDITVEVDRTSLAREAVRSALKSALRTAAFNIEGDAKLAIQQGPKTGRIYRAESQVNFATKNGKQVSFTAHKGSTKAHQASAPGEAPATDTANLIGSITTDFANIENLEAEINVGADYGSDLEFGTVKMAARPFMGPAALKTSEALPGIVAEAVNKELR